jgi:hypothetical protein
MLISALLLNVVNEGQRIHDAELRLSTIVHLPPSDRHLVMGKLWSSIMVGNLQLREVVVKASSVWESSRIPSCRSAICGALSSRCANFEAPASGRTCSDWLVRNYITSLLKENGFGPKGLETSFLPEPRGKFGKVGNFRAQLKGKIKVPVPQYTILWIKAHSDPFKVES